MPGKRSTYVSGVPRRTTSHPLAKAIGNRIREVRLAAGLTMEKLAFESDFSKGHLSSLERGLVVPTVATLAVLAKRLEVDLVDLVNDPNAKSAGDRARLIELTRGLAAGPLRKLVRDLTAAARIRAPRSR